MDVKSSASYLTAHNKQDSKEIFEIAPRNKSILRNYTE